MIQPTTWNQENLSEETFVTWAGPGQGTKEIQGKNFEAYVRVMPHSEYISGSACLCQGVHEYVDSWVSSNLGIEDSLSLTVSLEKYSSQTEPGITPKEDITLFYLDVISVKNACGASRLKGGMHFTSAVANAYDLCEGVGYVGTAFSQGLWGYDDDGNNGGDEDDETNKMPKATKAPKSMKKQK